jgi:hypothetical protein
MDSSVSYGPSSRRTCTSGYTRAASSALVVVAITVSALAMMKVSSPVPVYASALRTAWAPSRASM